MLSVIPLKRQAASHMKLKQALPLRSARLTVNSGSRVRTILSAVASGVVGLLLLGGLVAEGLGSIMVYGLWH